MMLPHLIIQFTLCYLSNDWLLEVKNKREFQTFSSKSGPGRLQEIPNIVIWLENFWHFETLVWGEVLAYKRFEI